MTTRLKRAIKKEMRLFVRPQEVVANIAEVSYGDLLQGRTALITGGTSGIDYEIAKAFIKAGATVRSISIPAKSSAFRPISRYAVSCSLRFSAKDCRATAAVATECYISYTTVRPDFCSTTMPS